MTPEGRVLRDLRLKHKLSMTAAGAKLGVTDSYISHIENGRANPPAGKSLDRFLEIYGRIGHKHFYELVREKKTHLSDEEIIIELMEKLKPEQLKVIRVLIEQILKS